VVALAAAGTLLLGGVTRADFISDTLGSAGPSNYGILSIGTGNTDVALNGPGTTNGNVGVLSGTLSLASSTPPAVNGNVQLGDNARTNFSAANQVQGSVLTGQNAVLQQAQTDALHASHAFAALSGNQVVPGGAITGTTTIHGFAGVNESVVNGILLAPDRGVAFSPGLVNGEVIAGGNTIHFVSGASVNQPPPPMVPEPASLLLLGLGIPALAGYAYRARRPRATPPSELPA
jgi:hypothetical protein